MCDARFTLKANGMAFFIFSFQCPLTLISFFLHKILCTTMAFTHFLLFARVLVVDFSCVSIFARKFFCLCPFMVCLAS